MKQNSRAGDVGQAGDVRKPGGLGQIAQVSEAVQVVKDYVRQETLCPLKGARRWIGYGVLGALLIGVGTAFLSLGVLRMIQAEFAPTFRGRWMALVPYLAAFGFSLVVGVLAFSRISKQPLSKEQS